MISVIIPVYNLRKHLKPCIESIFGQTYQNFELLLVDDGSTDGSSGICDLYADDDRVSVYHKKNGGVSSARNMGLDAAKGEYVMFVDGDDVVSSYIMERMVADFHNYPELVMTRCNFARLKSGEQFEDCEAAEKNIREIFKANDFIKSFLKGKYQNVGVCGALIKKDAIGSLRFAEGRSYNEDKFFLYNLLTNNSGGMVCISDDKLYGYTIRENSATHMSFSERQLDCLYFSEKIVKDAKENEKIWLTEAEYHDMVIHLAIMKSIVRSGKNNVKKKIFQEVRRDAIKLYGKRGKNFFGRYYLDFFIMKRSEQLYSVCVWAYDFARKNR